MTNKKGIENGNLHSVNVGEHWRLQTLRSPYMCPLLEADGIKYNPAKHVFLEINRDHLKDGKLSDSCCYFDVEILKIDDEVIECKTLKDLEGSYAIFEVLNDDTIVRFFNKKKV